MQGKSLASTRIVRTRSHGAASLHRSAPVFRMAPLAHALAALLLAGGSSAAHAAGGAWFAQSGSSKGAGFTRSPAIVMPGGNARAQQQQAQAQQRLQQSIQNLNRSASSISQQLAMQAAARRAAQDEVSAPDGYRQGGLWDKDASGNALAWSGAERPVASEQNGQTKVTVKQTADKAILNWDTFDIGRNTTLAFDQKSTDAVLNKVVGSVAPSRIQGRIQGDGTVMVVNQNGVVFSGSSQVDVRNLVVAATRTDQTRTEGGQTINLLDEQFLQRGIFSADDSTAAFSGAQGAIQVQAGASIVTRAPSTATQGGGYVLLMGTEVHNAGAISTPAGQVTMAAGDDFIIRRGQGTESNLYSTTRGNEVTAVRRNLATSALVENAGLLIATTGDITLTGADVRQQGSIAATTSVDVRGTLHLRTAAQSGEAAGQVGSITLAPQATSAILLEANTDLTALDSQRKAALELLAKPEASRYRTDQSLVEIVSDGTVDFQDQSLTLATGGQIAVTAGARALVRQGATLDVSGAVGVRVAMESNNLSVNIQGNEQRDAPVNRDDGALNSNDVWVDRRDLVFVKGDYNADTNPNGTPDRWYTAGGLLEVSGYVANAEHTAGEWMAQGGTVRFAGKEVVTQAGSRINLSGGTLDVQPGYINMSWLRGADGRLYNVSTAPGDILYTGIYNGYEATSARWGEKATRRFYSPLIGPRQRYEAGYTVGRDAGSLVVATTASVLEGELVSDVFNGDRQVDRPQAGVDGYNQSQTAAARRARLWIGNYLPTYDTATGVLGYELDKTWIGQEIVFGGAQQGLAETLGLDTPMSEEQAGTIRLDAEALGRYRLGGITTASESVTVDNVLQVDNGGEIALNAHDVQINANLVARGGRISLGDAELPDQANADAHVSVAENVMLDARGIWTDLRRDAADVSGVPYVDGGSVILRSTGSVTLQQGSVIDVSSGGVLERDRALRRAGRGGDVTLAANVRALNKVPGVVTIGGDIRGYGVVGGGTLMVESGATVSIGGRVLEQNGILKAGEITKAALVLNEELSVDVGDALPVDYAYIKNFAAAGEVVEAFPSSWPFVTLIGDWHIPIPINVLGGGEVIQIFYNDSDGVSHYLQLTPRDTQQAIIPKGSVITFMSRSSPSISFPSFTVPDGVFREGFPIAPTPAVIKAGNPSPVATTFSPGTLIPAGVSLGEDVAVLPVLQLPQPFFEAGFTHYDVRSQTELLVASNSTLNVRMPVFTLNVEAQQIASPGATSEIIRTWLPPIYLQDPISAVLKQRGGASLTLGSGSAVLNAYRTLSVEEGAVITVDPGEQIRLFSTGQMTVDGTLNAPGGSITLGQIGIAATSAGEGYNSGVSQAHTRSIWIGDHALLDVSGRAEMAVDQQGRRYGNVSEGGSIVVGGQIDETKGTVSAPDLFVVVRPGAVLDASGAAGSLYVQGKGEQSVASAGGSIALSSSAGLYTDGTLRAASGGEGAAGGTLAVGLEAPFYRTAGVQSAVLQPRELLLRQAQGASQLADDAQPDLSAGLTYGQATLGVDRISAGGFDNLVLFSNGLISFDGNVSLDMGQSIRLYSKAMGLSQDAADSSRVALNSPYLRLAGVSTIKSPGDVYTSPALSDGQTRLYTAGDLRAIADLIDIRDAVHFGAKGTVPQVLGALSVERRTFNDVTLYSRGDIRFLGGVSTSQIASGVSTELASPRNINLMAAQVYPATGVGARVLVGRDWGTASDGSTLYDPDYKLTIGRTTDADPAVPYSVFGSLTLGASTIEQGGVLRAPLGSLVFGTQTGSIGIANHVVLLPGSLTSVSAAGLVMPYGGTTDGITYSYAGQTVNLQGVGSLASSVTLGGRQVDVQQGAILDLSGGGDLTGAAFVSGRGGSTDARYHPLVQNRADGSFTLPGLNTNPVYAIVPSSQAVYAPVAAEGGAVDPNIGRQITIGAGVSGLPAGTYTLLPSTYALLPGAFRVELNGAASAAVPDRALALRNGSWSVAGRLSTVNTGSATRPGGIQDTLSTRITLTSADVLRKYSQYVETSYADFVRADAQRLGVARAMLPADARTLRLSLKPGAGADSFHFEGLARFQGAEDGYGGAVTVDGTNSGRVEIVGPDAAATPGYAGVTYRADQLNALGAPRLQIGGNARATYGADGNQMTFAGAENGLTREVVLRAGAQLSAPEVFLIADDPLGTSRSIVIEPGASINTIGRGAPAYDSSQGYYYATVGGASSSVIAASNGWLDLIAVDATQNPDTASNLSIGVCATACVDTTRLYSEGTIALAADGDIQFGDAVRYGTRNLSLLVSAFNVGSAESLAQAAAQRTLPNGLTLNQELLGRLLSGDTDYGAPALENLILTARQSLNFFGTVSLDTRDPVTGVSSLSRLVLGAPAIYGAGAAGDVATLSTSTLVWNGAATAPGAIINGGAGTGAGTLNVEAERIEFGFGPSAQANGSASLDRMAVGFDTVNLNASDRVTANHKGTFSVYASRGAYVEGSGYAYEGGTLNINTPLLTGEAGAVSRVKAGGAITLATPQGQQSGASSDALGAEWAFDGASINVDSAIVLPSGKLTLAAQGDVTLTGNARIDMSGRKVDFFDVSQYSWGGDVVVQSRAGNITQAAGSTVDLSAQNNQAGRLTATALDASAGLIDLQGGILGAASGQYDAGGTLVSYGFGGVELHGQRIADFSGLNQRLTDGQVFGLRSFQTKEEGLALVVGDELRARQIEVSVDNGTLTVQGKVDASGEQVGSIRLAAGRGLTLAGTSLLDTHGTALRVDSYGKIIDAPNRAVIELNAGSGQLVLADGARMDLRAGTGAPLAADAARPAAGENDGLPRGTVTLYAPRLGGVTAGDVDVDARGTVSIQGAQTVALVANQRYADSDAAQDADADAVVRPGTDAASGKAYRLIDQAYLNKKNAQSVLFMDAAVADLRSGGTLAGKLGGLLAYQDAFHLRPGVEIVTANDLRISGDVDLSGYRYASVNPHSQKTAVYGSGEPGVLTIRAAGNMDINGSLTDGFSLPNGLVTPDDNGWILKTGLQPFGGDVVVPASGLVTLNDGTSYPAGTKLNFAVPIKAVTLTAGTVIGADVTLSAPLVVPAGTVLAAPIYSAGGAVLQAAGTRLAESVTLAAGTRLGAGSVLTANAAINAMTWPAGVPLPATFLQNGRLALKAGSIVPWNVNVRLVGNPASVVLRPRTASNGQQGYNWAVAQLLPEGSLSWSMRLVAGADAAAADTRARLAGAQGSLTLGDAHVATSGTKSLYPVFSVLRTGTGDLDVLASGDFRMLSQYGVYTAGTQSAGGDDAAYNLARGTYTPSSSSVLGAEGSSYEPFVNDGSARNLYAAYYPTGGGDLLLRAGGTISGDSLGVSTQDPTSTDRIQHSSANVGNWLWRQGTGSGSGADSVDTAWWINFGTYTRAPFSFDSAVFAGINMPYLTGFTGVGTLGGGNLTVESGGNAGTLAARGGTDTKDVPRSDGLVLAVGSTGRVDGATGALTLTGGGDLNVRIGGQFNPYVDRAMSPSGQAQMDLFGVLANLRGDTALSAASLGSLSLAYGIANPADVRALEPLRASRASAFGGLVVLPGDSSFSLSTRGDLVLAGAGDPGRVALQNSTPFTMGDTEYSGGGLSWFSLWTGHSGINLSSVGGNLTPSTQTENANLSGLVTPISGQNYSQTDGRFVFPSILSAVASSGSIYFSSFGTGPSAAPYALMLAPSASSSLKLLAQDSVYASNYSVNVSGADPAFVPTPQRAAFVGRTDSGENSVVVASNVGADSVGSTVERFPIVAFGSASAADVSRTNDVAMRVYANQGDIVGLRTGELLTFSTGQVQYEGAGPVWMLAGRDIVGSGTRLGQPGSLPQEFSGGAGTSIGNVFIHTHQDDISVVSAGRDIIFGSFNVAGPGTLDISAGRNLRQENQASIASLGPIVNVDPNDHSSGANIAITVGAGKNGPDYAAFVRQYLDPANQAVTGQPLADQPGKVVHVYSGELTLTQWLAENYGYTGDAEGEQAFLQAKQQELDAVRAADTTAARRDLARDYQQASQLHLVNWLRTRYGEGTTSGQHYDGTTDAVAFFNSLPAEQQRVYARNVYFAELKAGGREYNDDGGVRAGSYLRSRQAIAALFPQNDAAGKPIAYDGDVTLFGDAGIQTRFGGDIQIMTPGGSQIYGVEGLPPPGINGTAGVITQGSGNIQLFSLDDVLLGQSRVMTTFGGDIVAWSVQGDINAGRGSKTALVYTPVRRVYDALGNVALSPNVPSTGAGFATLDPLPEVAPGDVDLYAPLGTIDAGEAGIRASGNVNVAALQVLNAANIKSQGESVGVPTIAAVNVGALTSASSAATSAASAAQDAVARSQAAARQNLPSIISVQVLGFGEEGAPAAPAPRPDRPRGQPVSYDPGSAIQMVGNGQLDAQGRSRLTDAERRNLAQ
ncbi:filamentous haemagglutinin family protein [Bordetella genomosp. 13]|uniref:filamentous haemagglutinin family protein n=1 Tax=Bordetella genomosp. 13 TaxID=463040 RepID=UPI0016425614|nr:filamentous haemagglutinin family protein [Bordetella genomosp. 13]